MTVEWKDITRFLCHNGLSDEEWKTLDGWMREGKELEEILENLMGMVEKRYKKDSLELNLQENIEKVSGRK